MIALSCHRASRESLSIVAGAPPSAQLTHSATMSGHAMQRAAPGVMPGRPSWSSMLWGADAAHGRYSPSDLTNQRTASAMIWAPIETGIASLLIDR